jgi:hypothetical protein
MDDRAPRSRFPTLIAAIAVAASCVGGLAVNGPAPAAAANADPYPARGGLELASAAAQAWSGDAVLVYVENDEGLNTAGASARWSYLFYSASEDRARVWSVRGGRIVVAENLDMRFDAPPVAAGWLDSAAAIAAAERGAGDEFRKLRGARLETMLLMRGALSEGDPDATTWTLVYRAPDLPALFVVVSAADGKVQRTWRG